MPVHFNAYEAEKWVRHGAITHIPALGGKVVEAKWHVARDKDRTVVSTHCRVKVSTVLGFQTRRTDPPVRERCARCVDDLARLHQEPKKLRARAAAKRRKKLGDKVDFGATREAAQKEGLISSSKTFKLKDGDNRVRLLAGPLAHDSTYNGKPNFKWLFYVLDRDDKSVKPMFMSPVIFDQIGDLQRDPDFEFSEMPMPFDLNIKTTNAGTLKARYSVIPSPKRIPLTADERAALDAATPLPDLQKLIRAKTGDQEPSEQRQNGERSFDPDEIPF